jgi:hypothetical protein
VGTIAHDAVLATAYAPTAADRPAIEAFREGLPESFRQLVVGPIEAAVNGYVTYAFLPDGSKEWWGTSDDADTARAAFVSLFNLSRWDVVSVRYGGDWALERGAIVEEVLP